MSTEFKYSELDFDQLKENFKNFLRAKPEYQDFDFDGSGWSYLIDLLIYNTTYNAFYLNMIASEMFLESAQLRSSVVSKCKLMNYLPYSKKSSRARIQIIFYPDILNLPSSIFINKDTTLFGKDDQNNQYIFNFLDEYQIYPDANNNFISPEIEIVEGSLLTYRFLVDNNSTQKYILPNVNVDISSIKVIVQESLYNEFQTYYTLASDITGLVSDSKVYYLQESHDGKIELYFGDDIISYKPKTGNVIIVEYLVSSGSSANNLSVFTPLSSLGTPVGGSLHSEEIIVIQKSLGGDDQESIDDIKRKAPLNLEVQNRGVMKTDFEFLILRDYLNIEAVSVWGGEDNVPKMYGHVFFAVKPKDGFLFDSVEKELLKNDLIEKYTTLTQIPVIIDPIYTNIVVIVNAKYDPKKTRRTKNELQRDIFNAILEFGENEIGKFQKNFMYSRFLEMVDNINPAILHNLSTIKLRMRIYPTLGVKQTYNLNFNNTFDIYDPTQIDGKVVHSTEFLYLNKVSYLAEESFGSSELCIFSKDGSTITKIKTIGVIDYTNGYVEINNFVPDSWIGNLNYLDITVRPKVFDIYSVREQILNILDSDIYVNVERVG